MVGPDSPTSGGRSRFGQAPATATVSTAAVARKPSTCASRPASFQHIPANRIMGKGLAAAPCPPAADCERLPGTARNACALNASSV